MTFPTDDNFVSPALTRPLRTEEEARREIAARNCLQCGGWRYTIWRHDNGDKTRVPCPTCTAEEREEGK